MTVAEEIADGMARADEHANPDWKEVATRAVMSTACRLPTFTADDVWHELEQMDPPDTHENSALGPVMKRAAKSGIIENTGEFRRSERPGTHGKPLPVWRSKVAHYYDGK